MAKFPSQKLMTYDTPNLTNDELQDCGVLNVPKDLSLLNRRGYASTTRKGVPLIYRTRFTLYSMTRAGKRPALNTDGAGNVSVDTDAETVPSADFTTLLRVTGCQDNWTMRNAAVKWHAARDSMWRQAGVKKSHLGAYAHEIRYSFDSASETFMTPTDGDGADFAGGTWDLTEINNGIDEDGFGLRLTGQGSDEDSATTPSIVTIGHSYLQSRRQPDADSNEGASSTPSNHSLLNATLFDIGDDGGNDPTDDIISNAKGQGDNLPYEVFDGATLNHDITEPVLLGQGVTSISTPVASFICDIPFGLAKIQARHSGAADQNIVDPVFFSAEVLKIFEMQG